MSDGDPAAEGSPASGSGPPACARGDTALCLLLSGTAGLVAWVGTSQLSGNLEAWDDPAYFPLVYPLLAVACGVCGWIARRHPWRWGLMAMAVQVAAMLLRGPSSSALLPVGIALMLVMSLPLTLAGAVGGWLHGRADRAHD